MTTAIKQRVLLFSLTPSNREPRLLKQIAALKNSYELTTAGFGPAPDVDIPHVELDPFGDSRNLLSVPGMYSCLLLFRRYGWLSRLFPRNASAYRLLSSASWDLIIAHDIATVPVAARLRSRTGVLVDLHEYATRQGEHSAKWRRVDGAYARWVLRKHVSKAAAVSTVGQGIADEYLREFDIKCDVVVNATPYRDVQPTPTKEPLRLVHSGAVAAPRKLEIMIEAVQRTQTPVTLDLYLVGNDDPYFQTLKDLAGNDPRISFRDPVAYEDLVRTLSEYDVGLAMIAPTTFNLLWCLPNKFFDYVQARLAIVTGPSPEMARITREYALGPVTDAFSTEALVATLDEMDRQSVDTWKRSAHRHAQELSSQTQVQVWKRMVDRLLSENAPKVAK